MYTNIDLKENKKMDEIIKANWRKVRVENINNAKKEKANNIIGGLVFISTIIIWAILLLSIIESL